MALPANEIRMDDGFSTTITMSNLPLAHLWEKEITPPAMQAGGPIDTTTMRNLKWRTKAPKQLKTMGKVTATCAYASVTFEELQEQVGQKQIFTVTFPDKSTWSFWGFMDEFTPGAYKEGDQPTAVVTFECSMTDLDGAEVDPVYTPFVETGEAESA